MCVNLWYGFCKFKTNCRKHHVSEKCTRSDCYIKSCRLRHPRICRYYRDIGFCKFGEWCLFEHEAGSYKGLNEVQELSEKIKNIEKLVEEKSMLIESLEKILNEVKETNKIETIEKFAKEVENKLKSWNLEAMLS